MRKGSAFPAGHSTNSSEATPRDGGTASNKSKAVTERHSLSALESGTAATGAEARPLGRAPVKLHGKAGKQQAGRPRSQQTRAAKQTIDDYSRDELITALLKGMGRKWWTREDAIRAAAHRLGFRRTGWHISKAFKSAINGAIRRGLLEADGRLLRKAR